jgi:hypothetical protein
MTVATVNESRISSKKAKIMVTTTAFAGKKIGSRPIELEIKILVSKRIPPFLPAG